MNLSRVHTRAASPTAGVSGASPENRAAPAPSASSAETGPLLPAQHDRPDPAHVHVCAPCPLDGVHLVCHRKDGEGGQPPAQVGSW